MADHPRTKLASQVPSTASARTPPGPLAPAPWDARRIERRLLALDNRRRIVDHVADRPGVHLRQVARDLGLALGTAEHHLHLLVRHGMLEVAEGPGQSCYFTPATPPGDRPLWAVLRHDAPRRLLRALAADPDLEAVDLAARLGVSKAAVAYHLKRLEGWGLVERLRVGRQRLLRVADPEALAAALAALDEERPPLAWPGLLLREVAVRTRVRPPPKECTSPAEPPTDAPLASARPEAGVRSSSA